MGSAPVLFLDGPIANEVREVRTFERVDAPGEGMPGVFNVAKSRAVTPLADPHDALAFDHVTYTIKPNRLSYGPRWCAAVGRHVGDQLVVTIPYHPAVPERVGVDTFEDFLTGEADASLQRFAGTEGLQAVEVHEVWRGTRADAQEQLAREGQAAPGPCAALAARIDDPMVYVVFEAVAMPKVVADE
ncbi:hypothetical protein SEA_LILPHARAOH_70 [Mycobacterium phage LilPharaoh]|uniref:Uncharacterized protein n=1 Tax=Mycobacterium phage Amelie TaxID=1913035 RepID=A0A1J0GQ58_9CAUD|nr:hypothetical protein AVV01_gp71 [Mycobacterium phage Enkosi]YP_009952587.1 hypothetical protein I5G92_gp69 [Mycobacterium phage Amelie]ATN90523.1 hypothetical protein SEA_LILPHARAOH_70 [Mycobacterium phage LilPharaoh]AVP42647.1 hypothetical protein SEA_SGTBEANSPROUT_70 [Mycobacterium phage SgtBeansprout]AXC37175.1 hypothetical protein SEA_BIGLEBOPS_69 [Mycobacterium phage Biglebops]QGJ93354.1 hypothetical protein PBI_MDAVU_70 [Mycobacterium phage Mdavu]UQS94469.1 hypothetical protein SEA_N